ncbi:glycosyl hydrolase [Prosthecochloris sp. ZM]|uniref:glycosyltransferase family 2 protein n=1 Tax=unclassified Prosthecochloris TaxID=2632826 RepID=UPI000DF760E6|nr:MULTISPECIES: glycosyltransferase family 2 protein [unclassified Prosthecochloris]NEX12110.1 glycosyltransferase family 2 protein [Prosthecochloris sp.]RDD30750.1 glycosyl hydrolase [Prosthecochloris sp. ZM]
MLVMPGPSVEVIIPHYRGRRLLERCLEALDQERYPGLRVCVVDNGTGASYIRRLAEAKDYVRVVRLQQNLGYAGGCNAGLFSSEAEYIVFFNDDAVAEHGWLKPLVSMAQRDVSVAAIQPKILSLSSRTAATHVFDYAGAAGGMLDRLCYPWCYGRSFKRVEDDAGQYDMQREIFWASGVALFARRSMVVAAGGFDEDFFMHMEEIDLCWRLRLSGLKVMTEPSSVVWHEGGATLGGGDPFKVRLNHRNNITMMIKNLGPGMLAGALPIRLFLELAAALFYTVSGPSGLQRSRSVFQALRDNVLIMPRTLGRRSEVQAQRRVSDRTLFRSAPCSMIVQALFSSSSSDAPN